MIAFVLLLPAAMLLGELPPQTLGAGRCATFLWTRTEPAVRIAMTDDTAATIRVMQGGKPRDLARVGPGRYAAPDLSITLDIDLETRSGMTQGSIVTQGSLRVEPAGGDAMVVPVGGIRACS